MNLVPSSRTRAAKSPRCAMVPPEQGAAYVSYVTSQRLVGATAVPLGAGRRRALSTSLDNSCYAACSYGGFVAPFFFETDPATNICYWCARFVTCPWVTRLRPRIMALWKTHISPRFSTRVTPHPAARLAIRCTHQGLSSMRPWRRRPSNRRLHRR